MEVRWHLWHLLTNYHHVIVGWRLGHSVVCYGMLLRVTDGGKTDSSPNLCSSTALETFNAEENQNGGFSLLLFVLKPRCALIIYRCSLFHHRKVHILMPPRSYRPNSGTKKNHMHSLQSDVYVPIQMWFVHKISESSL